MEPGDPAGLNFQWTLIEGLQGDLTAPYAAARTAWGRGEGEAVDWLTLRVDLSAAEIRAALHDLPRVYLLLVNAPNECVIGGEPSQVRAAAQRLGCDGAPIGDAAAVHCPVVRAVADAYRDLHRLQQEPID